MYLLHIWSGDEVTYESDLKSKIFWDAMPCNSSHTKRRFWEMYYLHIQKQSAIQAASHHRKSFKSNMNMITLLYLNKQF
jgi:hypothetical protein